MTATYAPTFAEQIEEQETLISHYRFLIEAYRTSGDAELLDRVGGLYQDIEDAEEEIERIKEERRAYIRNVEFAD